MPERQEIGDSGIQVPRNARKKLVGEDKELSPSIFFSSLLGAQTSRRAEPVFSPPLEPAPSLGACARVLYVNSRIEIS